MKKKLIISGVVLTLVIAGIIGWKMTKSVPEPTGSSLPTVKVDRGTIEKVVFAKGVIAETGRQEIKTEVRSKVNRLMVKPGDTVKPGDLLFTLDDGDAKLLLEQEQLNYQLKLDSLNRTKKKTPSDKVVSPVPGKLSKLLVKEGDRVQEFTPIAEIVDPDLLEVTAPFGPVDFERIKLGQKAKLLSDDTAGYVDATITKIDKKGRADDGGGLVHDVTVRFKNPGGVTLGKKATILVDFTDGSNLQSFYNEGIVKTLEPVKVRANSTGIVEKLEFAEGDLVKQNSILVKLNIGDETQQVKESALALRQSQLAIEIKQKELSKFQVVANQAGIVTEVNVTVGQEPPNDKPAIVISNTAGLELRAKIEESDIAFIHPGQPAMVYANAFSDRGFPSVITEIARIGKNEGSTVSFETKISIKEPGPLRAGMNGDVDIVVEKRENILRLPLSAIAIDGQKGKVLLKGKKDPLSREVTLGLEGEEYIEILSGVKAGDEILVNAQGRQ